MAVNRDHPCCAKTASCKLVTKTADQKATRGRGDTATRRQELQSCCLSSLGVYPGGSLPRRVAASPRRRGALRSSLVSCLFLRCRVAAELPELEALHLACGRARQSIDNDNLRRRFVARQPCGGKSFQFSDNFFGIIFSSAD